MQEQEVSGGRIGDVCLRDYSGVGAVRGALAGDPQSADRVYRQSWPGDHPLYGRDPGVARPADGAGVPGEQADAGPPARNPGAAEALSQGSAEALRRDYAPLPGTPHQPTREHPADPGPVTALARP